jgi:Tfp pilus tip-associated adhesin PilY1
MNNKPASITKRALTYLVIASLVAEPALAGTTDISSVPLASSSGAGVLPNAMYILDDSGSMAFDYLPDYVNDTLTCMDENGGNTTCGAGDPPFYSGGPNGFNGVAYDPTNFYQPGVNSDGTTKLSAPLSTTALTPDAYLGGTNVNLTTGIADIRYCNASSSAVCKRNGSDDASPPVLVSGADPFGNTMTAGRFPYRTNPSNSSTAIFGLPEMMSMGSFARATTVVTVTTVPAHGLTTSDRVWVAHSNSNFNAACLQVTGTTTNTFTYTSGSSGTISASAGSYRKCVHLTTTPSFVRAGTTVTVASPGHGLVTNDRITVRNTGQATFDVSGAAVTVITANSFSYQSGTSAATTTNVGSWVRTGLYNVASGVNGAALTYTITPVEYCSDVLLTTCTLATTPGTAPSGFPLPAYVRFCNSREAALAPGLVTGSSRCQAKYVNSGSLVYKYPRYGLFNREFIRSSSAPFLNRAGRVDCLSAPSCDYNEEIQNYARWYTYYRTRMQMMKSGTGRALLGFIGNPSASPAKPNVLRVGFMTIHPTFSNSSSSSDQGTFQAAKYLRINSFDTAQATTFYSKMYAIIPDQGTPLQQALSRAGWIFAGKLGSGLTPGLTAADDPMIASCQRNFALLTTDGYWNGALGQDLSGNNVGNQDGVTPTVIAPYTERMVDRATTVTYDGSDPSVVTATSITVSPVTDQAICQGDNPVFGGATTCGCAPTEHRLAQRARDQIRTVTTTGGVVQSDTTIINPTATITFPTACTAGDSVTTVTPTTETEDNLCSKNNNTTFSTGGANNAAGQQACGCGTTGTPSQKRIKRRVITYTETRIDTDGVLTSLTNSNITSGPTFTNQGSCVSTGGTPAPGIGVSPNPDAVDGTPAVTTVAGTPLTITLSPNPQTGAPVSSSSTATGGIANTLADVAMYYYMNDLRGGTDAGGNPTGPATSLGGTGTVDVATNNVPTKAGAKDFVTHQHMVTFTLGLADGLMDYQPNYEASTTGDFAAIKNGTAGACFWTGSGTCNWPTPAADAPSALDDLWHAAVNGRGQYYQALNAQALSLGLSGALSALNAQLAAAAASATSSPNVTQTDNQIFSTTYETNTWSGKVFAQTIDPTTGAVSTAIQWQADTQLLAKVSASSDTRNIVTFDDAGSTKVKAFAYAGLGSDQTYFDNKCSGTAPLGQCAIIPIVGSQLTVANSGANMVGFLRGWTGLELSDPAVGVYRDRTYIDPVTSAVTQTVMGDTISAKPAYVRNPIFSYGSEGPTGGNYDDFKATNASRSPRVYVGANDGYMHAFDGATGDESWAYVPRFMFPALYRLADTGYSSTHQFYVDGTPETADVLDKTVTPNVWKTILVGGVGGGGRGYYALDVTNPSSPKGLWEFCDSSLCAISDANLGLTYGNPVIGKRSSDGRWVVVVSSGLNNVPSGASTGDGKGYFYVLDAITGAKLDTLSTGVGSTTTPSGLMKMAPWYDAPATDATFRYVYAGDQLGNLWRLDLGTSASPTATVTHMAQFKDAGGKLQPITTRPVLTRIGSDRVIYVGTGRYLGNKDLTDPATQTPVDSVTAWQESLYAFKDKNADYGNDFRNDANLVVQSFTSLSPTTRGVTTNPVTWSSSGTDGWMIDFNPTFPGDPAAGNSPGERLNIDPRLILGTLVLVTNIPATGGSCSVGGSHFNYNLDFRTGSAVSTSAGGVAGSSGGGTIAVGMAIVQLPSGAIKDIITGADTSKSTTDVSINSSASGVKRFSYRER